MLRSVAKAASKPKRGIPEVLNNPGIGLQHLNLSFDVQSDRPCVTMDVLALVQVLTNSTEAQRFEYSRHLLLQAKQRGESEPVHNLYSSIEREGWGAFSARNGGAKQKAKKPPPAAGGPAAAFERELIARELSEMASLLSASLGFGVEANRAQVATEREAKLEAESVKAEEAVATTKAAAEKAEKAKAKEAPELRAQADQAMEAAATARSEAKAAKAKGAVTSRYAFRGEAAKDVVSEETLHATAEGPVVEEGSLTIDMVRSGNSRVDSLIKPEPRPAAEGASRRAVSAPPPPRAAQAVVQQAGGGACSGAAVAMSEASAVLACFPRWAAVPGKGRLQATLRFDPPGVCAGDAVSVAGPRGDQLALLVPPGVMHVHSAVASISADASVQRTRETALRLEIVALEHAAVASGRLSVRWAGADIQIVLPPTATAGAALTLALPFAGPPLPPPRPLAQPPPPRIASGVAPPAPPLEFEQESAAGEFEFELSETTREGEA